MFDLGSLYLKRANNLIDVLGINDKIVTSQCDRVSNKNFGTKVCMLNQNFS